MHISDSSKKKYNMALYILSDIFSWLIFFIFFHVLHVLQTYSWFSHPGWQDGAILEPWNTKTFRTVKCFYRVNKVSPLDVREAVKNVLADFVR